MGFTTLAKAYRDARKRVINCPNCEMPHLSIREERVVKCKDCNTEFTSINHYHTTIAAVEAITNDRIGYNDGWARCPRCKMIISKGFGCDHMQCVCGHDFSWTEALKKKDNRYENVKIVVPKTIDTLDV